MKNNSEETKKVFCGKCKHYMSFQNGKDNCDHPENLVNTYVGLNAGRLYLPKSKNRDYACEWFEYKNESNDEAIDDRIRKLRIFNSDIDDVVYRTFNRITRIRDILRNNTLRVPFSIEVMGKHILSISWKCTNPDIDWWEICVYNKKGDLIKLPTGDKNIMIEVSKNLNKFLSVAEEELRKKSAEMSELLYGFGK